MMYNSENDFLKKISCVIAAVDHIQGVPGGMCQTSGECSLC